MATIDMEISYPRSAVLDNADLLRLIGEYLQRSQFPFILSFKAVREALKPLNHVSGEIWIKSKKRYFVTSVSMVEWAQSLGCEFNLTGPDNNIFTYAASNGSVDVLRWLHQKHPPKQYSAGVSQYVCGKAAYNGHIEVLKYLQSLGTIVEWNDIVCSYAAREGQLHVLQWLRGELDPPCPWDSLACSEAADNGHLHVLKWLRAQDPPCRWSHFSCSNAAMKGHLDMLKWLRSQDPPCPWLKQVCVTFARRHNHRKVVEWILSLPE